MLSTSKACCLRRKESRELSRHVMFHSLNPISYQRTRGCCVCLVESFSIAISSLFLLLKLLFVLYISCPFSSPRYSSICNCSYLIFFEIPFALPASPGQAIPGARGQCPSPPNSFGKSLLGGSDSSRCMLQRMLMGRGTGGVGSSSPQPKITPMHIPP